MQVPGAARVVRQYMRRGPDWNAGGIRRAGGGALTAREGGLRCAIREEFKNPQGKQLALTETVNSAKNRDQRAVIASRRA